MSSTLYTLQEEIVGCLSEALPLGRSLVLSGTGQDDDFQVDYHNVLLLFVSLIIYNNLYSIAYNILCASGNSIYNVCDVSNTGLSCD